MIWSLLAYKEALPELLAAFERLNLDSNGCLKEEEFLRLPIDTIRVEELKKLSVNDMAHLFQLLDVDGRAWSMILCVLVLQNDPPVFPNIWQTRPGVIHFQFFCPTEFDALFHEEAC